MCVSSCLLLYFWPKHLRNFVIPVALQIAEGNKGIGRSSKSVAELGVDLGSCAWCQSVVIHIHSSLWCAFPQPCCDTRFFGVCEWSSVSTEQWARSAHKAETSNTKDPFSALVFVLLELPVVFCGNSTWKVHCIVYKRDCHELVISQFVWPMPDLERSGPC